MPARASSAAAFLCANSGCAARNARDDGVVLLRQHAARRVDEPSAGLHERRGRREDPRLLRRELRDVATACCRHLRSGLRRSVPKPVHGASTSTRSILPARRFTLASRSCAMHLRVHVRQPRAREPRLRGCASRFATTSNAYSAPLRAHQRAEQQRLAAGAGAEVDDHVVASRRDQRSRSSWLPSSCTSRRPSASHGCSASDGRPRDANAERRVRRRRRVEARRSRARRAPSSRVVFSGLTRRSNGAGACHARASAARSASPYTSPRRSHSQSGRSAATAGGSG